MKVNIASDTRTFLVDLRKRLVQARSWLLLQFIGLAVLIALGLLWTRIPEKNAGQVLLTLLVPALIAATFLWLQAGTIRSLLSPIGNDDAKRSIPFALVFLLGLCVSGFLLWILIDHFDDHIYSWAGYLNSRFNAESRSHFATYEHFSLWLNGASWLLRWVIVPGLILPFGCATAFRLRLFPWKTPFRVWMEWRWWLLLLILAFIAQVWTGTFFETLPHGSVHAQVWRVVLKIAASYILAVCCWLIALAWTAVLISRKNREAHGPEPIAEPAYLSPSGSRSKSVKLPLPDPE